MNSTPRNVNDGNELSPKALAENPRGDCELSVQEQLEFAEKTLDRHLDWVGRSDTKFSVVLGVDTGMLGFLAAPALTKPVPTSTIVCAVVAVALLLASLAFVYRGTYPRTQGPEGSLIYFHSIAGKDLKQFKERFRTCGANDRLDDVLEQVHRNAEILAVKFVELQRAYRCLLVAVAPWAIALYLSGVVPPST